MQMLCAYRQPISDSARTFHMPTTTVIVLTIERVCVGPDAAETRGG